MLTGCFGLLAAAADVFPEFGDEIRASLGGDDEIGPGKPPWEVAIQDLGGLCYEK